MESRPASSARTRVIVTPEDVNPHVETLTRRIEVESGTHDIEVDLASTPGATLDLAVRFGADVTLPSAELAIGAEGRISLAGLADAPDPFSPADQNGVRDTTTLRFVATALQTPGSASGHFLYVARTRFDIGGGPTCGATISLSRSVALTRNDPAVVDVVWDGRDAGGDLVADGDYFYRATVTFVRRDPSTGQETILDEVVSPIQRVTVDNTPPTVELVGMEQGVSLLGTRAVSLRATDASGVTSADFVVDGTTFGSKENEAPTPVFSPSFVVDTGLLANGPHILSGSAVDVAGNLGVSPDVSVSVANATGLQIASVDPPGAGPGTLVTITGSGFEPGHTTVRVGGSAAELDAVTTTGIRFVMPASATSDRATWSWRRRADPRRRPSHSSRCATARRSGRPESFPTRTPLSRWSASSSAKAAAFASAQASSSPLRSSRSTT